MKINSDSAFEYTIGNKKIGKDTLIFNMGSAAECPSKKLGMCTLCKECYAMKAEKQYPSVREFRKRQGEYWRETASSRIKADIRQALKKHKKVTRVRINESGDLYNVLDLNLLVRIAHENMDVTFYMYTHRADVVKLNKLTIPSNLVISISNQKLEGFNEFRAVDKQTYKELPSNALKCKGDCRDCKLCKINHNKTVFVEVH